MTDMGRIYIILGEPLSKEMFDVSGIYPAEVWTYNGDKTKGLPTQFNLVFFQRSGAGEYKLYNPISDGPVALIIDRQGLNLSDQRALYDKILELAPTLAGPSISLIPGQRSYNYIPSPGKTSSWRISLTRPERISTRPMPLTFSITGELSAQII